MGVHLTVLGAMTLTIGDSSVEPGGMTRRAVLTRLAIDANTVVPTERLVDDLWPDAAPERATATLQTYIWQLRSLLGPEYLETERPGYRLKLAPDAFDLSAFRSALAQARGPAVDDQTRADLYRKALALWGPSPALGDFDAPWASDLLGQLENERLLALTEANDARLRLGDHHSLWVELETLAHRNPLHEPFWAQLMLALYRSGRQSEALACYARARAALVEEVGIEPGPELRQLEQAILAHDPALRLDTGPVAGLTDHDGDLESCLCWVTPQPLPFVGRGPELTQLVAAGRDLSGQRRLLLVRGEPGIGKTRLLAEAAQVLGPDQSLLVFGHCEEHPQGPYLPFSEIVAHTARHNPASADALSPAARRVLSQLAPELGPGLEPGEIGDPETLRYQLFDGVTDLLRAAAAGRPLLVFIDDLHWADDATAMLLRHLLDVAPGVPTIVVASIRSTETAMVPVVTDLLTQLERAGRLDHLDLHGLTTKAVQELLLSAVSDSSESSTIEARAIGQRIRTETDGNPLFASEIIHQISVNGIPGSTDDPVAVPASLRSVIIDRLNRLPEDASGLLHAASVLGLRFNGSLAADTAGLDDRRAADAFDAGTQARLIIEGEDGAGDYRFPHALVRNIVYEELSQARRVRLHRAAATELEQRHERGVPSLTAAMAHHFTAAVPLGEAPRAVQYTWAAGDAALNQFAYAEAADFFRQALALLAEHPEAGGTLERCLLLLALAEAEHRRGNRWIAKEEVVRAAEAARTLQRPDLLARAALSYEGTLPTAADIDDPRGIELLREAIEMLPEEQRSEHALLRGRLAQQQYWSASYRERVQLADGAVALAREVGDTRILATVLTNRYWALDGPDDVPGRLANATEIERIAVELGDIDVAMAGGKCHLHLLLELGRTTEADELSRRLSQFAVEAHQPDFVRLGVGYEAMRAGVRGEWAKAEQLARRNRELLEAQGQMIHGELIHTVQILCWEWLRGRLADWVDTLWLLTELDPIREGWWAYAAWASAETGQLEGARRGLDHVDLPRLIARERVMTWLGVAALCATSVSRLDDKYLAGLLYEALLPYRDRMCSVGQIGFYGAVSHHLGLLADTLGMECEAEAHFRDAILRHEHAQARPFEALSRRGLAQVLANSGDPELRAEAAEHSQQALILAERLDLRLLTAPTQQ